MSDLDNISAEQWAKEMGNASPGGSVTTTGTTAPTETVKADEVPRETIAAETPAQTEARARNPDGTFAPKPEGETAAPVAREPFDGFSKLTPEVQREFNRMLGERDDLKLRYTRLNGEYRRATRQNGSGPPSQPAQQPRSGAPQVGQAATDARQNVGAMRPGQQRDAVQSQIDAWEQHARDYPDDAKAIEQRLGKLANDIANGLHGPLHQELQGLRSQLEEMRSGYDAMQAERAEAISHEHQQTLDQVAGDNWRQIAGWEDEHGNPIPSDKWQWHPEFAAWINGHDPDESSEMWERLGHKSPRVVGNLIAAFNRDRFQLDSGAASGQGQATPAQPHNQRADNLRDVAPGARGTAKPTSTPTWTPTGNEYVDAVRSPAYSEWLKA